LLTKEFRLESFRKQTSEPQLISARQTRSGSDAYFSYFQMKMAVVEKKWWW